MASDSKVVWQTGTVIESADAADGVRRIVLAVDTPVAASPGAHVDVDVPSDGRVLRRSYSVVRSEDGGRLLTISVHLSPASRGGSRAMHALVAGDRLRVTSPLQNFPLGVGAARYELLAGGIGVTALLAMATALRRRGQDYRFSYVGRSRRAMAWLEDLQATHAERLSVHVDDEGTSLDVQGLVADIAAGLHPADTELYLCGPIRLMDAVRRAWAQHELPPANLRFETFGNSGAWEPQEFVVHIPDLQKMVTVPRELSILDALERAGVEVMSDCRKGECGLCTASVRVCDGHIDHRDVFFDDQEKALDRKICLCVSRVASTDTDAQPSISPRLVIERP